MQHAKPSPTPMVATQNLTLMDGELLDNPTDYREAVEIFNISLLKGMMLPLL